jgi:hypothetical protein
MRKEQWYQVTRPDGTIQYATKYEGEDQYFLYGDGFPIKKFDALSVEPCDDPPVIMVEGMAWLDDSPKWRAITNINARWNGWALPSLHESAIKSLIEYLSYDEMYKIELKEGNLILTYTDDQEYVTVIEPHIWNGEKYYGFANEGWCWEFKQSKTKKQ